jgi:hypothetical protein
VVGVPLGVVAALKEPQGEVAQVTAQLTPTPVLVVAVMEVVAPVTSEAGCPLRETVGVGGVFEPPPPQEVRRKVKVASMQEIASFRGALFTLGASEAG